MDNDPEEFIGADPITPADAPSYVAESQPRRADGRIGRRQPPMPPEPESEARLTELRARLHEANLEVKRTRIALDIALRNWSSHGRSASDVLRDQIASNQMARKARLAPKVTVPGPSWYDQARMRAQPHAGENPIDRGFNQRRNSTTRQDLTHKRAAPWPPRAPGSKPLPPSVKLPSE